MLDEDESQRMKTKKAHNPSAFSVQSENSHMAMAVINPGYQKTADKPRAVCSHCNMFGHIVDRYYKVHGYPLGWKYKRDPKSKPSHQHAPKISTNMVLTYSCSSQARFEIANFNFFFQC